MTEQIATNFDIHNFLSFSPSKIKIINIWLETIQFDDERMKVLKIKINISLEIFLLELWTIISFQHL